MSTVSDPFLERAATWATSLSSEDIPAGVKRAARAQRASTLGAAIWSSIHPIGAEIAGATRAQFPSGEATLLGPNGGDASPPSESDSDPAIDGGRSPDGGLSPGGAVYGNAALSMALDFDDTVLGGHTGHSAVFTALAYAQVHEADRETALCAHVAANEVAARLSSAAAIGPFRGQQTTYVHAVGAAVARAVVADDGPTTLANALGIALGQPPWPLDAAFFGSDAKHWLASEGARTGLSAIDAARCGQQGNPTTVEGAEGFLEEFAKIPLPAFLEGLGDRWHTRAVTVKAVPGCAYVTAPVEAAVDVASSNDISLGDIEAVTVRGSLFATEVNERATPYLAASRGDSPLSALTFTIPYNVAVALADGEHTPRQLTPDRLEDTAVWEVAERVEVVHDKAFTMAALESEVPVGAMLRRVGWPVVLYSAKTIGPWTTLANLPTLAQFVRKRPLPTDLASADKRMGAEVEVTANGQTYAATVDHPAGFAGQALGDIEDIAREKYREALVAAGASDTAATETVSAWCAAAAETEGLPQLRPPAGRSEMGANDRQ